MEEWSIIWRKLLEIALVLEINSFSCQFALWVHTICTFFKKKWEVIWRSSHRRCFVKKSVLKDFANFIGKHLCWSLFLKKLQAFTPLFWRTSANNCFWLFSPNSAWDPEKPFSKPRELLINSNFKWLLPPSTKFYLQIPSPGEVLQRRCF